MLGKPYLFVYLSKRVSVFGILPMLLVHLVDVDVGCWMLVDGLGMYLLE